MYFYEVGYDLLSGLGGVPSDVEGVHHNCFVFWIHFA